MLDGVIVADVKQEAVVISRKNTVPKNTNQIIGTQQQDSAKSANNESYPSNDFLPEANHISWASDILKFVLEQYRFNPSSLHRTEFRAFSYEQGRLIVCTAIASNLLLLAVAPYKTHNELARTSLILSVSHTCVQ